MNLKSDFPSRKNFLQLPLTCIVWWKPDPKLMPYTLSDKLRTFLGAFSVPGLIRYVALLNALVFVLHLIAPGYTSLLELVPSLVLQGQVWRLITWIFIPETLSPFWIIFAVLFLFYLGDGLEAAMGSGKLTLFYLTGVVLCTAASFVFGWSGASGASLAHANTFLNLSLLLAYATLYPSFKVLVFFILPVRIVWLAIFSAALMILSSIGQPPVVAATLGVAFLNYLLFFGKTLQLEYQIFKRRTRPVAVISGLSKAGSQQDPIHTFHRCHVCGRSENSQPQLEFRVSADGEEYCSDHRPR
jgi:membrane associated rhomboid family serine protease